MKITKYIAIFAMAFTIAGAVLSMSAPQAEAASFTVLNGGDLSVGSTGGAVVQLQGLLSELGYLSVPQGVPLGYYGSLTRSALAQYQLNINVTPTNGILNSLTRQIIINDMSARGWLPLLNSSY